MKKYIYIGVFALFVFLMCFCIGIIIKRENKDYQSQSIYYWESITSKYDLDYVVKWLKKNKSVSEIYMNDEKVYYDRKKEGTFDSNSYIDDFVKNTGIEIINCGEYGKNSICFLCDFSCQNRIIGKYELVYCDDEKIIKEFSNDFRYKIKKNYYCNVIYYE